MAATTTSGRRDDLWIGHGLVSRLACLGHRDDARRIFTDPVAGGGSGETFSAKGLVPNAVAASPAFLSAAAGAALTVSAASRLGLPVSTTHSLTGALIGAGLASGSGVNLAVLGKSFFLPLIGCPLWPSPSPRSLSPGPLRAAPLGHHPRLLHPHRGRSGSRQCERS